MDSSLDLVDHFKLEAEQLPEYTQHTHYKSDRSHGLRRLKVVKRWRKKHDIGEGAFGVVWLEVEEDGSERAVKAISRRLCSYSKIDYRKELAAMAILSKYEELFVAFQGWFEDPEHIFVAMEYFKHGDLQRHMNIKMPEIQVKIVITQVLEGLKTMHQLGFTHRDLKPQARHNLLFPTPMNIFVVDTDPIFWVKIGDFGITKRILNEQTFLRTEIGTMDYLAPEVLGYVDEETSRYTNAVDLWSLGCICHRLLTLESPFPKMTALARYCLGMTELPIEALYKSTVTEEAITLVKDLMNAQPSERINAEAALHSLWLKDVGSLDSTFTVQSESRLPANTDNGLVLHDAKVTQDSKLPETSIHTRETSIDTKKPLIDTKLLIDTKPSVDPMMTSIDTRKLLIDTKPLFDKKPLFDTWMTSVETRKKKRKALYIEIPPTTKNGQRPPSIVSLRPALEHRISNTESKQQEGSNSMSRNNSIPTSPSALEEDDTDASSLKGFLDAGFDLENYNVDSQGYAVEAFEWAARQPIPDCLNLLLRRSRMIDVIESLSWAVRENLLITVQAIVEATHIDINRQSYNGLTLLHLACMHGHEKIARYLLEKGAHLNTGDTSGMTSHYLALFADRKAGGSIAELLERHDALKGHIPLTSAPAVTELMLSRPRRNTARIRLPELRLPERSRFEAITTVQELPVEVLSRGEYLAARFRMAGHYPHVLALADHAFRWAAKENSEDLMVYVLEYGAPVDVNALLRSAEVTCNSEAIALLEAKRAAADPLYLFTEPLYTACFYGQIVAVIALLDRVPSVKEVLRSKDHRGRTALHYAVEGQHTIGTMNPQRRNGAPWEQGEKLINMLLSQGADPNQEDMNGETAPISAEARKFYATVIKGRLVSPPTPEEACSEIETTETPADTRKSSSTDDEVSSPKGEVSSRDETGKGVVYKLKKHTPRSWWLK